MKLKKDYIENGDLGDSFDLVPIGAYLGNGKRAGVYGCFLMASWNANMERFETLCVTGRGITDEKFKELFDFFNQHKLEGPLPEYNVKNIYVDVWFEPCVVGKSKDLIYSLVQCTLVVLELLMRIEVLDLDFQES